MTPIDFYVFPRSEVNRIAPISQPFLANWEAARPGVLDDIDIFLPNSRTFKHPKTAYELFNRVEDVGSDTVIVCENWLELLNADGMHHRIADLMGEIRARYPHNPKVWSWNSDADEAVVFDLQRLPDNEFVLCFNSTKTHRQDIVLPFWNVDCRHSFDPLAERPLCGGFIGFVGGVTVRQRLRDVFRNRDGWEFLDTVHFGKRPQEYYLARMKAWDFALCPRGGGLNSYRFYEAIQQGCVPILFADDIVLPYPDLPWGELIVRLPERDADNFKLISDVLSHMDAKVRRQRLAEVRERFSLKGVQECIHQRLTEYLS